MAGPGYYLLGDEEIKEVMDVLESRHFSRYGDDNDVNFKRKVITFEKEFSEKMGAKHCIAVNSGASALMTCLAALGIGAGDEVIVPGFTFAASITSIILSNAIPVLAEIDESLTVDPIDIEKKITERTKAIMPVHLLGNPCDMDRIMEIANKYGLYVIEDCCQAVGASYKGKRVGAIGDIGAHSLNNFKMLTAGEGGAVVTNNDEYYERAYAFHDQGHKPYRVGEENWQRKYLGMNFRINELTGALALAQLRKLDYILSTLRNKKKKLKEMLLDIDGLGFRVINDEEGECATLLTAIFESKEIAERFAKEIGSKTNANLNWHVYNYMDNVLNKETISKNGCPYTCEKYGNSVIYSKHMLPRTDDLLGRSVNISVGVIDKGLGSTFGIGILSNDDEIVEVAERIKGVMKIII